jgi:hypothetical protein
MATYKFIASEFGKVLHEGEFDSPDEVEEVLLFLTEYFGCRVECIQIQKPGLKKPDFSKPVKRSSEPDDKESFVGFLIWIIVSVLILGVGVSVIAISVYHPTKRSTSTDDQRPNPTATDLLIPDVYR